MRSRMVRDEVVVRLVNMPGTVRACTVVGEDVYNVYLNARLTHELQQKALRHELRHIEAGDFESAEHIREIERRT